MIAKYRTNTNIDDTSLIFTERPEVATEPPENTTDVTRCIDPVRRIISMAAARFGNESGEDSFSDECSGSEENVDDYESYDGVLGYQYEPKRRVRSPVAVPIEPGTEGTSPSSTGIASDTDSRTHSDSVVALPPDTHSVPDRVGNTDCIGVNHPAIVREIPHFYVFPAFPHFSENVPHFWLYFENQIFLIIVIILGARKKLCA